MHTIPVLDIKHFAAKCCSGAKRWIAAAAGLLVLGSIPPARAQFYFDVTSGSGLGTATGSNSWNSTIWNNNDSSGNSGREAWSNGNSVIFNAGSGTYSANITTSGTTVSGVTVSQGNVTISKSGSGTFAMSANSTFNVVSSLTVSAPIGGAFSLTKTGAGTLTFSGANTYSGSTNIGTSGGVSGGTLALGASDVLPGTTVNIYGGTLSLGANNDVIGALNLGGGAAATSASVTGTGTLSLGGNLTYSATNNAQGATISSNLSLNGSNRTFTINDSSNVAAADDLTVSGVISNGSGNRGIIKTGAGTLALTNTNTYTGNTTINAGTIKITADTNLGAAPVSATAGKLTLGGGTLEAASSLTLSSNRGIALTSSTTSNLTADTSQTLTYGGIIAGAGNITYGTATTGTGTVALSGASTYTGTTTINAGTVKISADNNLGAAPGSATAGKLTLSGGSLEAASSLTLSSNRGIALSTGTTSNITADNSQTLTYGGIIAGSGNLTYGTATTGTGTVTLSGNSSYTGTTAINAGTAVVTANNALGTNGNGTTINSGGTLGFQGVTYSTTEAVSLSGTGATGRSGAIDNISGTSSFAGALTVTDDARIGATAGALTLSGTVNLSASAAADATLTFNPAASSSITASGKLTDALNNSFALGVAHIGNGTVTLSNGTNDYWGNTTIGTAGGVTTGTLALGASGALPTVNNATTLRIYSGTLNLANNSATSFGSLVLGGGGAGSTAAITTGTGTLTLGGNVTFDAANNADGATITGKLALGSANRTFTINDSTATNAANDLAVAAVVSGTGGLIKTGTGTLQLSGTNSYSGTTTVNVGTLKVSADANLGTAPGSATAGKLTLGGGSLEASSSFTLNSNRGIALTTATTSNITADNSQTLTYGGIIAGSGNLTLGTATTGAGIVSLSGANSYTGTTTVNAGTLRAGAANTFSSSSAVSLADAAGATLDLNNFSQTIGSLAGGGAAGGNVSLGTGTLTTGGNGSSTTYDGVISGTGGNLTKAGAGTFTLGGTNLYTGTTTLNTGTLAFGNNSALGTSGLTINGGTIQASGGARTLANNVSLGGNFTVGGSNDLTLSGTIALNGSNRTVTVNNSGLTTFSGSINQATYTGLIKEGNGSLLLSGTNLNTGPTAVNAGTLILGNSAALGATGVYGNTVASGATLALQGNINVAPGGLTVTGSGFGSNGAIRNLSGSNTLGGQVTLGAGTTVVNSDSGLLTFSGAIQNSSNALTVGGSGNITASGQITGAGGITKNGTGTLTLSGSTGNSAAALTVNDGSVILAKTGGVSALGYGSAIIVGDGAGTAGSALLQLGGNGQLNTSAGSIAVNADGLFDLNGYAATTSSLTGTGTVALGSTGALTVSIASGTTIFGGSITGGGSLTKTGSGTFSLTGTNNYSGATNVNVGTLLIGSATALSTSSAVTIASGATLDLGNYSATFASLAGTGTVQLSGASNNTLTIGDANDTTLAANVGNTGAGVLSFVKQGTGTVTLSGNNTYGGSTTINLGTLKMGLAGYSGGGPLGTTAAGTIVNSGGALDLNGFTLTNAEALSLQGSGAGSGGALTNSSGTAATYSGAVTLAGNTSIGGTGNITLTAGLNDGGVARTLTKVGTGNLLLNATPSSWTANNNVVVNNGTLEVGVTNALGASALSNVTVNANAASTTATLATSASTTQSILGLTLGGAGGTTTSTNNVAIGSSSTLTLGGNVTYDATGNPLGSTISGGTLGLGSSTRTFTVGDSSTMAGTSVATSELAVSSVISGTGGLTKLGTGTLALTGVNTFTGNVAVNAGTLIASNSSGSTGGFAALGVHNGLLSDTTVVTVGSNATLAVSGVTSPVTTNTDTQQFMTMSLNGSGANGAGAINAIGGNSTWRGNVTLAGNTTIQNSAAAGNQNLLFFGPYILHSPTYFNLNNNALTLNGTGDIYISSTIGNSGGDTGSVTLNGTGTTYFAGERNYYTGDTTVNSGRLELRTKPINPTLLPDVGVLGNLTIGDGSGSANSAVVADYYSDQIANTSNITINSDGLLDLGTYSRADTVGNVTLKGGRIDSGTGMLFLNGTMTADNQVISNTATTSTIDGRITFNSNNTVNVVGTNTLTLNAWVANGSFVKDGTGTMVMTNDNYNGGNGYYGITTVHDGILNIQNSGALGRYNGGSPSAGTVVESGATLQLENNGSNINVAAEALSINGSGFGGIGALNSKSGANSWNGPITVGSGATIGQDARIQTDAGSLTIYGSVTGTKSSGEQTLTLAGSGNTTITGPISNGSYGGSLGISKVGSGTATLNGVDTFTGAINVSGGTLDIAAHDVLGAHTNAVNVGAAGTFSVSGGSGNTNTIGSLTGTGTVSIAGSTVLKVNNTSADTFGGTLTGSGLLEKTGSGTFTFNSTATNALAFGSGTIQLTASASTDTLEFQGGSISNIVGIGNLTLTGGTLLLTGSTINVGTLNITGNTILDFGTSGASILNANNIYIAAGATLTIVNWTSEVDFLFANSDFRQTNGGGTLAIFNQVGSPPANQVHFQGDPWSPDGSHTTWINSGYDGYTNFEIRPIPEPSTYGAILLAGCIGLLAWKRLRKRSGSPTA